MKIACCLFVASLVAPVASAFPLLKGATHPAAPGGNCTNFSGDYHGTCTVQGQQVSKSTHVTQSGCESLTVDGDEFQIGAVITKSTSAPAEVEMARFNWDAEKKNLLLTGATLDGTSDVVAVKGTVSLRDGNLYESLKIVGPTEQDYGTCVLTHQ